MVWTGISKIFGQSCNAGPFGEAMMPILVINALLSGFFAVRVFKGPWLRNPQYLGIAMVGCVLAMMALDAAEPGMADELIAGNLAALAGAFVAIKLFDRLLKSG